MVAIILAAGYATRLQQYTTNTPKALLKIGEKTMLDHILDKFANVPQFTKIALVSNHKFYLNFTEWFEVRKKDWDRAFINNVGGKLIILNDGTVSEETRRGAIGDIAFAVEELELDEEAMIIAGDNFFTFRLSDFYEFYKQKNADCVVVKRIGNKEVLKTVGVAVVADGNRVTEFEEKPNEPKSDLAVYATYLYRRDTLPLFRKYLDDGNPKDAPGNFPAWLCKRRPVYAYEFDGECYDVGTPEAYKSLRDMYGNKNNDNS